MRDFWGSRGVMNPENPNYVAQLESAPGLEDLLRPILGPTTADDAVLDDVSEVDSDNDMEDNDEGEEGNDAEGEEEAAYNNENGD